MAETIAAALVYAGMGTEVATVAAAGTTAASAATAASIAATAGTVSSVMSTVGTIGSLVMGGVSAFGSIMGGNQQAKIASANAAAEAAQLNLEQAAAEKDASERALDTVKQLRMTIARNNAYYSASGADISSGTPAAVQDANMEEADRQLRIDRSSTDLAVAGYKAKAAAVQSIGESTAAQYKSAGYWKAAGSMLDSLDRYTKRGV